MSTYTFWYTHRDPILETEILHDLECEVEVDADDPTDIRVTDVLVNGKSLRIGDAVSKALSYQIMDAAEQNISEAGHLWDEIKEEHGYVYRGLGGNDPDGHWHRAVA